VTVVLDASAGIEVVLSRSRSIDIASVLESSKRVYAPGLYKAEITNALWKYLRTGQLSKEDAKEALRIALGLIDEYVNIQDFTDEVLSESVRLNHSAYDMSTPVKALIPSAERRGHITAGRYMSFKLVTRYVMGYA
jgi:predicted nucleic acid-binding protein